MKAISIVDIKQIQLDILADIHTFCQNNNIYYSLAYGTLLGAVRHKGYIPWDDDIDIMIPRDDYDRFIQLYNSPIYSVADISKITDYHLPYAKVYDSRTILNEYSEVSVKYGVNIDLFPIDNVPDNKYERNLWLMNKLVLNRIHTLKIVKVKRERSVLKNFTLAFSHLLLSPIRLSNLVKSMHNCSIKYYGKPTKLIGIVAPNDNKAREIWDSKLFKKYTLLPFENIQCQVIESYNEFLISAYGDYMELPPVEQRITHHAFEAWWK